MTDGLPCRGELSIALHLRASIEDLVPHVQITWDGEMIYGVGLDVDLYQATVSCFHERWF